MWYIKYVIQIFIGFYRWIWLGRVTGLKLSLTRFNVLKTLHIFPLNDCLLLLILVFFSMTWMISELWLVRSCRFWSRRFSDWVWSLIFPRYPVNNLLDWCAVVRQPNWRYYPVPVPVSDGKKCRIVKQDFKLIWILQDFG